MLHQHFEPQNSSKLLYFIFVAAAILCLTLLASIKSIYSSVSPDGKHLVVPHENNLGYANSHYFEEVKHITETEGKYYFQEIHDKDSKPLQTKQDKEFDSSIRDIKHAIEREEQKVHLLKHENNYLVEELNALEQIIDVVVEKLVSFTSNKSVDARNDLIQNLLANTSEEIQFGSIYGKEWKSHKKQVMEFIYEDSLNDTLLPERSEYFTNIFQLILANKPNIRPLSHYMNGRISNAVYANRQTTPCLTVDELSSHLILEDSDVQALQDTHHRFVRTLSSIYPNDIYEPGTRGIVYVGGKESSWSIMLSIMNIRDSGCNLPVEVLIPSYHEYSLDMCKNVYPRYNARCLFLPGLISGKVRHRNKIHRHQYKSVALALSSFEEVLLLDADNYLLDNPEKLFYSKPFQENGMVTWPDLWKRTTHPRFYTIIGKDITTDTERRDYGYTEYGQRFTQVCEKEEDVPLHQLEGTMADPSSDSSQLLISKREHIGTIILSMYYNTYGPEYYYPILSQGASGQGDKETFVAAAHALDKKYYTVKKMPEFVGSLVQEKWRANAVAQFDATEDYEIAERYRDSTEEVAEQPAVLLLHVKSRELHPWRKYHDERVPHKGDTGRSRLYGDDFPNVAKYDFELETWRNMEKLLCEDKIRFHVFEREGVSTEEACREVLEQIAYLESNSM